MGHLQWPLPQMPLAGTTIILLQWTCIHITEDFIRLYNKIYIYNVIKACSAKGRASSAFECWRSGKKKKKMSGMGTIPNNDPLWDKKQSVTWQISCSWNQSKLPATGFGGICEKSSGRFSQASSKVNGRWALNSPLWLSKKMWPATFNLLGSRFAKTLLLQRQ